MVRKSKRASADDAAVKAIQERLAKETKERFEKFGVPRQASARPARPFGAQRGKP